MPINPKLLQILACPDCRGGITYKKSTKKSPEHLVCNKCGRIFEIQNNIPIMMPKD